MIVKIQILLLLGAILNLISCSNKEELPTPDVHEIRKIGVLSTTEYTIGKIIKLDDKAEEWYKYGDRKILIHCRAKIKAGIDLDKIEKEDIVVEGDQIEITLPEVEIVSFEMDPKHVRTEVENITGFRDRFTQEEKNKILKQGEKAILKDIEKTGIYKDAQKNTAAFLEDFFKEQGYKEVIINYVQQSDKK